MSFANCSALIGSGSIEIPERNEAESISSAIGFESVLKCQLGCAVRIHRPARIALSDWHLHRIAVDGARGGKNKFPHAGFHDRIEQRQRSCHVVVKIFSWV